MLCFQWRSPFTGDPEPTFLLRHFAGPDAVLEFHLLGYAQ
jgi:hypothetical protein